MGSNLFTHEAYLRYLDASGELYHPDQEQADLIQSSQSKTPQTLAKSSSVELLITL